MDKVKTKTAPAGNRIFAIGDIHGCFDKLTRLLHILPYDRGRDTLVFLGDYIDRGPQSREVVTLLCRLEAEGGNTVFLIGNHEYLLLQYARTADEALLPHLRRLGVEATLASYDARNLLDVVDLAFLPTEHRRFLNRLVPVWETTEFFFVHAGCLPGRSLLDQEAESLCETRGQFLTEDFDFGKRVIFGHTAFESPLVTPTKIGIDTGAVYGNLLTAVELPAVRFYHA